MQPRDLVLGFDIRKIRLYTHYFKLEACGDTRHQKVFVTFSARRCDAQTVRAQSM
jgi:hypothetical protein